MQPQWSATYRAVPPIPVPASSTASSGVIPNMSTSWLVARRPMVWKSSSIHRSAGARWSSSLPAATSACSILRRDTPVEYWVGIWVLYISASSGRIGGKGGFRTMRLGGCRMGLHCPELMLGLDGRCRVLVSPDRGLSRKPRMLGLGVLLSSVKAVETVHRHDRDQ